MNLIEQYNIYKNKNLKLDMSRGKPSTAQLDLSQQILNQITKNSECFSQEGIDCRNYGNPDGISEMKEVFAIMTEIPQKNIIIMGGSSLNIMFDTVSNAWCFGICGNEPWCKQEKIKFLCPVPGYDRHFAITEKFGIEMINIPMDKNGPDMDMVECFASSDSSIKGIWCVPKYSNPSGCTYSDGTVKRLATMKPAAKDFRIFWDNAYCVHHLNDTPDTLLNLFEELQKNGNGDNAYCFASTSKITYAGAGVSCIGTSDNNICDIMSTLKIRTINNDKINMLRHAGYLSNAEKIRNIMNGHKNIIAPKFNLTLKYFENELSHIKGVSWTTPNGGYFINLNLPKNTAKKVVLMAAEAGLVLTPAGASFPYGVDPDDSSIRIAPTYPSVDELEDALKLLCICVKLVVS